MPDSRIKIKKSAGIKKQEKKGIKVPESEKRYKVTVKATDPGAREKKYTSIKQTEITEKKANKLASKSQRRDIENPGKLAQVIKEVTNKPSVRYAGTKVASGKSNLNLKGRVAKVFIGKEGVAMAESKKPNNQFERATKGTQKFVTTKEASGPIPPPTPPVKHPIPKFQLTIKHGSIPKSSEIKKEAEKAKETRIPVAELKRVEKTVPKTPPTRVDSGPTLDPKEKQKRVPTTSQKYVNGKLVKVIHNK